MSVHGVFFWKYFYFVSLKLFNHFLKSLKSKTLQIINLKYLFSKVGLIDAFILGEEHPDVASNSLTVIPGSPGAELSCEGDTPESNGHWLVCKSNINCPVVRVASRNEICNYWSFYGQNPGFVGSLTLAPHQARVLTHLI